MRKYQNHTLETNPWHHEDTQDNNSHKTSGKQKQSKATSSLFPIKMIAKLERTQSIAYQNKEQTQTPHTMRATIKQWVNNNRNTTLAQTATYATEGLKCILLVPNFHPRFFCC